MLTELDVINEMLGIMGESPLNAVDEDHPLVASCLRTLRTVNAREQAKSWWFNREIVTLKPDPATGFTYVPADTLSIDPTSAWTHLVQRGRRLFDPSGAGYLIGRPVQVHLIRLVPFEDLPAMAQAYISVSAQLDFQTNYDADEAKVRKLTASRQEAFQVLRAEDIRAASVNLLYTSNNLHRMTTLGLKPVLPGYRVVQTTPVDTSEGANTPLVDFSQIFTEALD